jgi:hypothetical protein
VLAVTTVPPSGWPGGWFFINFPVCTPELPQIIEKNIDLEIEALRDQRRATHDATYKHALPRARSASLRFENKVLAIAAMPV